MSRAAPQGLYKCYISISTYVDLAPSPSSRRERTNKAGHTFRVHGGCELDKNNPFFGGVVLAGDLGEMESSAAH